MLIPPRRELKYLLADEQARALARQLPPFCGLDAHSKGAPEGQYQVTSLYLDTPRHQLYWASRAEQPGRLKARIRAYEEGPVFFELKRKDHQVVRKTHAAAPRDGWAERLGAPLADDAEAGERDFRAVVERHLLAPTVLVRYRREAWVGLYDAYARVTIDRALQYQPCAALALEGDPGGWHSFDDRRAAFGVERAVVVELKCGLSVPLWMQRLIERLSLHRQSFSKYCLSIERAYGRHHPMGLSPTVPTWF